jgi:hypothetical protein
MREAFLTLGEPNCATRQASSKAKGRLFLHLREAYRFHNEQQKLKCSAALNIKFSSGHCECTSFLYLFYTNLNSAEETKERHYASAHNPSGGNRGSGFGGSGFGRGDLRRPAPAEWQMLVL